MERARHLPLYLALMASNPSVSRRKILGKASAVAVISMAAQRGARAQSGSVGSASGGKGRFVYCLNTSTIRGHKVPLMKEIELASKAGYTAMEPWIGEINEHVKGGGTAADLRKAFSDNGIAVVNAIGFAPWIVGDDEARKKGLDMMKRDMELVAQVGGTRIAAPPAGATELKNFDLNVAAERYRQILEMGEKTGVMPMLEVWGFSKTLGTLAEAAYVAVASKHPSATILADVYHLYKGGSGHDGLRLIDGAALPVMHMNDYPADPPRDKIKDEHRVFPGDGVAPIGSVLKQLASTGASTALSLELFNKEYWKRDVAEVLRTGVEKMKAAVEKAQV
jgi:sugar phosphate isomerase/epimerase